MAGNGELSLVLVGTAIYDLQFVEIIFDVCLEVLPVDLVLGISLLVLIFGQEVHNQRVFEILNHKLNTTLFVANDRRCLLLLFAVCRGAILLFGFFRCFRLTLAKGTHLLLRELFVVFATNTRFAL